MRRLRRGIGAGVAVGFGDITADTTADRIYVTGLMVHFTPHSPSAGAQLKT